MRVARHFNRGQAYFELAHAIPILLLLLLGTIDFGRAFYYHQQVVAAARAGAQYGSQSVASAADTSGIQNAALHNAPNVPGFVAANTTASFCTCQSPVPTGQTACGTGYCNGANAQATYVTVTSTATFTTLLNYPGIPHTSPMSGKAIMQVQE